MATTKLNVDGVDVAVDTAADATLLSTLRDQLGLTATKAGCLVGYCGACTVLLDGRVAHACCVLTAACDGCEVETASSTSEDMRQAQTAFVEAGAIQCGYCTPGFVVAVVGHARDSTVDADSASHTEALAGNICRCSGYVKIRDGMERFLRETAGRGGRSREA